MDGTINSASGGGDSSTGGGGAQAASVPMASQSNAPPPFLSKTYDMVDDPATDAVVSWSSTNNSFVVWNLPEFSRDLLPKMVKDSCGFVLFNVEHNLLCEVELGFLQVFYSLVIENIGEGKGCVCGPFYELVVDPGMFISVCYIVDECHGVDLSNCSQLGELFSSRENRLWF
ncbi:HEAT SHOCK TRANSCRIPTION FACTOR [Salix koriyanagi]|uniref:HEAT SHOCK TRANSCRIPTION FACTOR n=1 Tax=Salix koriyanagi TaxID=2511006 RepID=A0A9Q0ZBM1_9ROSI|nr:HEAT SHOCK TRANSCRIPTION FACTOR [Salix koriyanagi]